MLNPGGVRIGTAEIYRQVSVCMTDDPAFAALACNSEEVDAADRRLCKTPPRLMARVLHPLTKIARDSAERFSVYNVCTRLLLTLHPDNYSSSICDTLGKKPCQWCCKRSWLAFMVHSGNLKREFMQREKTIANRRHFFRDLLCTHGAPPHRCTHARRRVVQVEMVPEVEDSVAIGLRVDGDVEIVLFVTLAPTAQGAGTNTQVRGVGRGPPIARERREPQTLEDQSRFRTDGRSDLTTQDRGRVTNQASSPPFTRASALRRSCFLLFFSGPLF